MVLSGDHLEGLVIMIRDLVPSSGMNAMSNETSGSSPSPVLGSPEVDSDNCKLMGPFALFVQAIMGILVIGSLVYKRQREKPRRKWKIWALDISKQLLGQFFVHILNVVLSDFVASGGGENPCSLYFLNILVDTTIGVFFIYMALKYVTYFLTDHLGLEGFVSGQYSPAPPTMTSSAANSSLQPRTTRFHPRNRPKLEYWLKQLASYLFVLFLMKMAVLIIFAIFPFLFDVGSWILALFGSHKDFQVLFSMALFPLAMNVLQFWLIDSLLRHNPYTSKYSKLSPEDEETLNTSDRLSQDSHHSEARGLGSRAYDSHMIGDASDEESDDDRPRSKIFGSKASRRRNSPQTQSTPTAQVDQQYDYPPESDMYGSVHKSPPLRPTDALDNLRKEARRTLSDTGSDDDEGSEAKPKGPASNRAPTMQRSESHHLKQVSGESRK